MPARFRYLGLARTAEDLEYVKDEMAISLTSIQGLLLPGLKDAMCGSKGSAPVTSPRTATELAMYQQLAEQQAGISPYNRGLEESFAALKRQVIGDNLYKQEYAPNPVPQITARELTKEELREKIARKLDLDETKITTAAEVVNHGRWRQIMDEVFKDDHKGGDDGKRTEVEDSGGNGRKRGNTSGGSDAG